MLSLQDLRIPALSLALVASLAACNSSDDDGGGTTAPPAESISSAIAELGLDAGIQATIDLLTSTAPAGIAGGATVSIDGNTSAAQGSTTSTTLTSVDAIDALIVRLGGLSGFFQIDFNDPQTSIDLLLSLAASAPAGTVDCIYQARRAGEADFGLPTSVPITVIDVGTGELQINLTWTSDADLDLHVTEPDGTKIFFGNPDSATGGMLDLDANVGCGNVSVENIFWSVAPPLGEYIVEVDNFSECSQATSDFVITVSTPGNAPQIFEGSVTELDGLLEVVRFTL